MSWAQDEIVRSFNRGGLPVFGCKKCHFQTASEMNAVCHVRVCHAPLPNNFRCDSCNFKTNDEDSLRVHSLIRHSVRLNKTYQCSECSFSSVDKMALMHHVHSVHYIAGCSSRK